MSTFIENPCTRMRKGGPSSRRPGGLHGGLLKRIVVRKQENEKQQKKKEHEKIQSPDGTAHNNKRHDLAGDGFPCI